MKIRRVFIINDNNDTIDGAFAEVVEFVKSGLLASGTVEVHVIGEAEGVERVRERAPKAKARRRATEPAAAPTTP